MRDVVYVRSSGNDPLPKRTSEWTTEDIIPMGHLLQSLMKTWMCFGCLFPLFNIMVNHTPVVSQRYNDPSMAFLPIQPKSPIKASSKSQAKAEYRSTSVNAAGSDIRCQGMAYFES